MGTLEIPVRIVDLPFYKELSADFNRLIEAVVNKDVERSLEIAEGLAVKYGEKKIEDIKDPKELAIRLHNDRCNSSHTDQCGWKYEISNGVHGWWYPSHKQWLGEAQALIAKREAEE